MKKLSGLILKGKTEVYSLNAHARKYLNALMERVWQYTFPSGSYSIDPHIGVERQHHLDEMFLQRAIKKAF
jgi:hypothetical protein